MGTINEESSPLSSPALGDPTTFGSYLLHRVPAVVFIISQPESAVSCLGILRLSQEL